MMRKNQKVKIICLITTLFILKCIPIWAQGSFKYKADIQKIDTNGIYKIELKHDLVAKSKDDLSDVRLLDNKGKFVAYALSTNLSVDNLERFVQFPEVIGSDGTDTAVVYIADNKNRLNISQLWLRLKNTSVNRSVNLSGSDDLKKWFAIKEDITLEGAGSGNDPEYEQLLNFPSSNFRYFKIQVNGKHKVSVKIVGSGIYIRTLNGPEFTTLPPVKFSSKDSNKVSHVFIHFDEPYRVNKIHLILSSPKYYNRRISVYNIRNKAAEWLGDSTISSPGSQDIVLSAKTAQIRVDISNGDDNPLDIKDIVAYQQKQYLITYLESGKDYYILEGDLSAPEVSYDLSFLKYKPYNQLPVISHFAVYKNPSFRVVHRANKPDHTLLIWVAIVIVLILLSFLTWKMVGEIKRNES